MSPTDISTYSLSSHYFYQLKTHAVYKRSSEGEIFHDNALEAGVSREHELVKSLSSEIQTLKDATKVHETTKMELAKVKEANERMEMELVQLGTNLVEIETLVESRTCELLEVTKELEMTQALAEENEAIATESKQVGMVKGDDERKRLQREELELEFRVFKQQINQVKTSDSDMKRALNEKEKSLQESLQWVELLEKEIANKDKEQSRIPSQTRIPLYLEAVEALAGLGLFPTTISESRCSESTAERVKDESNNEVCH
uniref:Uncharacterized protein n=1 Tax=Lactuca sativa TaxID=4236 RepID=A0A9R1XT24_LACSA|nr:hypothetical protein LSAT_V11C100024690 [Lactuca sativa]